MNKKRILWTLVGTLLVTNGATYWKYKDDMNTKNEIISTYSNENVRLDKLVIVKNKLVKTKQIEVNTHQEENIKLNKLINCKQIEIDKLDKKLNEARNKESPSP